MPPLTYHIDAPYTETVSCAANCSRHGSGPKSASTLPKCVYLVHRLWTPQGMASGPFEKCLAKPSLYTLGALSASNPTIHPSCVVPRFSCFQSADHGVFFHIVDEDVAIQRRRAELRPPTKPHFFRRTWTKINFEEYLHIANMMTSGNLSSKAMSHRILKSQHGPKLQPHPEPSPKLHNP